MKIIAESAFNHNGSLKELKELANAAKEAEADYFTVQVMSSNGFCTNNYSKVNIYRENSFSQKEWTEVFQHCSDIGIHVIPCVLEESSFDFCYDYGFRLLKIHGTDLTNIPFLSLIKQKEDVKIILETQCSTFQDIECGLEILRNNVEAIFHGYSDFPTEIEELNLNAIKYLKRNFPNFKFGIADHSPTVKEIPILALGLGYDYIEKHITLSRNNRNFDWQVSLYKEEFSMMVQALNMYSKALGKELKHPTKRELSYRSIIYKKVQEDTNILKRSDDGMDFLSSEFNSLDKERVGIALIARLKSQRLKQKVLKKFSKNSIIEDLYSRLLTTNKISSIHLATSNLEEDAPLVSILGTEKSFVGHPISVIDRMLSLARREKVGGIFRVTGDNPFTDPDLIDRMVELFSEHDLDYVRANNVPFGVSAELFSTRYLWELYLNMDNPLNSEYLSWFVLNDEKARKGCFNFIPKDDRTRFVNLSIDYSKDYDRALSLLERINKKEPESITMKDIVTNLDLNDIIKSDKKIKLPENNSITYSNYLSLMNNIDYAIKIDLHEKDLFNW